MAYGKKLKLVYSKEAKRKIIKMNRSRTNRIPKNELITYIIMAINVIVFILMTFNGGSTHIPTLLKFGAAQRDYIFVGKQYYRLFTPMFLHIGIQHLAFNSLSLYILGTRIEHHFGRINFLIIYILSGIVGNFAMALTSINVSAGASGAIFGLTGATLALTQKTKKPVDGLNFQSIVMLIAVNIIIGLLTPNIGNAAHIGGLAAGYGLGMLLIMINKSRRYI